MSILLKWFFVAVLFNSLLYGAASFTSTPSATVNENILYTYSPTTTDFSGALTWGIKAGTSLPNWLDYGISLGNISNVAGIGTAGYTGNGAAATSAQIRQPVGVAVDSSGDIYFAEYTNYVIRKVVISTGNIVLVAGTNSAGFAANGTVATSAALTDPMTIVFDAQDNLYYADRGGHAVRMIPKVSGTYFGVAMTANNIYTIVGSGTLGSSNNGDSALGNTLNQPFGVALDSNGSIYIADSINHRIKMVPKTTGTYFGISMTANKIYTIAGTGTLGLDNGVLATSAKIDTPQGMDVDSDGNIYFTSRAKDVVMMIPKTSGTYFGQSMSANYIYTVAGTGTGATGADGVGTSVNLFDPVDVKYDGVGNLFIMDRGSHTVRVLYRNGNLKTVVGTLGTLGSTGDGGAASSAKVNAPFGIAFDSNGAFYIGDFSNHKVRKVNTSVVLSGTPTSGDVGVENVVLSVTDGTTTVEQPFSVSVANITANAPAITFTPTDITVTEDVASNVDLSSATFTSGDADTLTLNLSISAGTFSTPSSSSSVTATKVSDTQISLVGTRANIDSYLNTTTNIKYTGDANVSGDNKAVLTLSLTDGNDLAPLANLKAHYKFEDDLNDSSSGKNALSTISGTPSYTTGVNGKGYSFSTNPLQNKTTGLSISTGSVAMWVKSNSDAGVLFSSGTANQADTFQLFKFRTYSNGTIAIGSGSVYDSFDDTNISDNKWHHLVLTFTGSDPTLYVDGVAQTKTTNNSLTSFGINTEIFIGSFAGGTAPFSGMVDDVRIYDKVLTTTEINGFFAKATSNIDITAVNDAPTDIALSANTLAENAASGTAIGTLSATDIDSGDSATFSLACASAGGDDANFTIDGTSLKSNAVFDYETKNSYSICVRVTDSGVAVYDKNLTITVTDAAEGAFTNNGGGTAITLTPSENQSAATTITTSGLSGTITYTLGGTDSASFNVDSNGVVTFISAPNYENKSSYSVTVTASNGATSITQTITANIQNANDAPSFTSSATTTATENSAYSYTPTASDPENNLTSISGTNLPSWLSLVQSSNSLVSTLAGSTSGSTDGTGTAAKFRNPFGIAVDSSGNIFVADSANHKIRKITPAGVVSTLAGSESKGSTDGIGTAASFNNPVGVSVDSSGNVYVADANNYKIRKITPDGNVSTLAGTGSKGSTDGTGTAASFYFPQGVSVDSNGNVYVADSSNNKIRKITPIGEVSTLAGSGSQGSTDGTGTAASFNYPTGVSVDSSGNVYVADRLNNKIRKITPDGNVSTLAGSGSRGSTDGIGTAASFNNPVGVSVDSSGNIFVADTGNHKIRKITPAGVVSTFTGNGRPRNNDGTVTTAAFNAPAGVAVDSSGNLYIADYGNHRVRKVSSGALKLEGTPTVSGVYDVNLSVTDGNLSTPQNFQITVADVNDAPVLNDVSFVISENNATGSTVGTLSATDEDGVNPSLALIGSAEVITYSIVSGNTNSDFAINSTTGVITVAKQLNATLRQTYSLSIKAQDDAGASKTATVTISVSNEADAPIAVADSTTLNEDSAASFDILANDTDQDNNLNKSSLIITKQPTNATVQIASANNGFVTYTPNANYNGADYFSYKVSDATGLESNEVNVTMTVTAVNDAPVATNQTLSTDEDINTTISLREYVTDIDGDNLTYSIVSGTSGTATISDGVISYDPDLNFYGFDSLTYEANDGTVDSTTKTININVAEVNDIPIANHDYENNTTEDSPITINVLSNDTDDGNLSVTTVTILKQAEHGTAVANGSGTITYTPTANYHGQDSFEYTVKDDGLVTSAGGSTGVLISNSALVTINIASVNDAPTANSDSATLDEDSVMLLNLHSNDTDVEGDLNGTAITIVTQPSHGEANVTESGLVRYIPTKDYNGSDSFTYKISDGDVNSSTATVSLTVTAVNDVPSITTDANQTIPENSTATIVTLAASDVENNTAFTFTKLSGKDGALFTLSGSDLSFSSARDYENPADTDTNNIYSVDVNVTDSLGGSSTRTFSVTVSDVSEAAPSGGGGGSTPTPPVVIPPVVTPPVVQPPVVTPPVVQPPVVEPPVVTPPVVAPPVVQPPVITPPVVTPPVVVEPTPTPELPKNEEAVVTGVTTLPATKDETNTKVSEKDTGVQTQAPQTAGDGTKTIIQMTDANGVSTKETEITTPTDVTKVVTSTKAGTQVDLESARTKSEVTVNNNGTIDTKVTNKETGEAFDMKSSAIGTDISVNTDGSFELSVNNTDVVGKDVKVENVDKNEQISESKTTLTSNGTIVEAKVVIKTTDPLTGLETTTTKTIDTVVTPNTKVSITDDGSIQLKEDSINSVKVIDPNTNKLTDANVNSLLEIKPDGTTIHIVELKTADGVTIQTSATSNLAGSKTETTDAGLHTTATVTLHGVENGLNKEVHVTIEVTADKSGKATHGMSFTNDAGESTTTSASSELVGATTVIDNNGKIETSIRFDKADVIKDINVIANTDGSAEHVMKFKSAVAGQSEDEVTTRATSKIVGAQTKIKTTGGVETTVNDKVGEFTIKAVVETDTDGNSITKFEKYDATGTLVETQKTTQSATLFEPGNKVIIENRDGKTVIDSTAKVSGLIEF